jgi:hypothetical protein
MKTPETYEGPRRLILEDPAVLIGCCAVRLPLGQPAACAADYPFGLAFRSTADSHRLPTCVGCQLAPTANLPASPSNSTSDSHRRQIQRPLPTDLRLTPPTNLPVCLPINLRLAPSIHLPARPSSRPPACAFVRPSGPAFEPNLRLSSVVASPAPPCANQRLAPPVNPWLCLRASLRPSPGANLPALPSRWPPTCADCQPSGSALEATSDSRQLLRSRRCRPFNL